MKNGGWRTTKGGIAYAAQVLAPCGRPFLYYGKVRLLCFSTLNIEHLALSSCGDRRQSQKISQNRSGSDERYPEADGNLRGNNRA